jgi:tetraacyldisaccharide 4'-kinase
VKSYFERKLQSIWFRPPRNWRDRFFMACARPLASYAEKRIIKTQEKRRSVLPPVPVIVVGNILVGGSGKTPLAIALANALTLRGFKVGLIASGYGSPAYDLADQAILVMPKSRAKSVGDEPVLLAKATQLPVAVSGQRLRALKTLLKEHPNIDVVVSDDGLQHAALPRTVECCLVDSRGFGNAEVLPAGPLREPVAALAQVDCLILNGMDDTPEFAAGLASAARPGEVLLDKILKKPRFSVYFSELRFLPIAQWQRRESSKENFRAITAKELAGIAAGRGIAALAGTAQPQAFFSALRQLGLLFAPYPLGDHAPLDKHTLRQIAEPFVIMTEKDAVKWPNGRAQLAWVAIRETQLDSRLIDWLIKKIKP